MWYLSYSKLVKNGEFILDCSIPWRTIAKHSRRRTAEEECLYFVDKLERLYGVLYNWVRVEQVGWDYNKQVGLCYKVIHPKRNGTLVIDYLLVDPYE